MADTLEKQLIRDEGLRLEVYNDHLNKPTVGIGHLVTTKDNLKLGDKISKSRALKFFREDVKTSKRDARRFVGEKTWKKLSEDVQNVVVNMAFNLGYTKLRQFKKLKGALVAEDYREAAKQMKESRWYSQVTNRAERLIGVILEEGSKAQNQRGEGRVFVEAYTRKDGSKVEGFWRSK